MVYFCMLCLKRSCYQFLFFIITNRSSWLYTNCHWLFFLSWLLIIERKFRGGCLTKISIIMMNKCLRELTCSNYMIKLFIRKVLRIDKLFYNFTVIFYRIWYLRAIAVILIYICIDGWLILIILWLAFSRSFKLTDSWFELIKMRIFRLDSLNFKFYWH